tara:strand:+ start:90568 stop:91506 length:939 start_codon:yes stop_codon:yes gene_type:complete
MNRQQAKKILHETFGYYSDKGNELLFACPACDHHKRKLSVNLDKNAFKCWVCDYRGRNIRHLVRRFGSYRQLQKWDEISGRADLSGFDSLFMVSSERNEKQKLDLPEEFETLTSTKIPATGTYAHKYLMSRGLSRSDIVRWKIGYCFSGEYRNRIIVPSFDEDGDVNYFMARSYNGDSYKYKNPKASKDVVFNELYVDWDTDLVLVEGIFDAIIAGNGVPILGSTLRSDSRLIQKIVRNDTPVYVALDSDAADKERKIIQTLLKYDVELYKIDVSGYEDVGSMSKEIFTERKRDAAFVDREDYLLRDLLSAI